MQVIADLQLHSKYSRAVSQKMDIREIARWAHLKGIDLVATGDWTHPLWFREIQANLQEDGSGLLKSKWEKAKGNMGVKFLLATEISSIYSQGGKLRRIHNLVWAPSLATVEKINRELNTRGANLLADGRPIVGLSSIDLCELVFSQDEQCLIIPAHCWTPWFSLYGSESGFDSIEECFGQYAKYIYAVETGLSSSPAMNWRIKELDRRAIVSFSDAHSGPKLGREATVFNLEKSSYQAIREAITGQAKSGKYQAGGNDISLNAPHLTLNANKIAYTIEFYPEEGKYHYTGHRSCGVKHSPADTARFGKTCPVCGRKLTVGVMHRVDQLAARRNEELGIRNLELGKGRAKAISSNVFLNRPPYVMLVPLQEILAEALGTLVGAQKVQIEYIKLVDAFGGEFAVLLEKALDEIARISGSRVAEAIAKVRSGDIVVDPGFDGVFGKVKIWGDKEKEKEVKEQLSLFQ